MLRTIKTLLAMGACAAFLLLIGAAPATSEELQPGKQWLAWTPAERNVYVQGFIEGYWKGSQTACRLADDLFEVGKPQRLGQGPSGRCEARLEKYSKIKFSDSGPDFNAYTTVVTDFYSKHPEYQHIPTGYLLFSLSDRNYGTADQLYQMVLKGGEWRAHS
jgi:hypothetical protein